VLQRCAPRLAAPMPPTAARGSVGRSPLRMPYAPRTRPSALCDRARNGARPPMPATATPADLPVPAARQLPRCANAATFLGREVGTIDDAGLAPRVLKCLRGSMMSPRPRDRLRLGLPFMRVWKRAPEKLLYRFMAPLNRHPARPMGAHRMHAFATGRSTGRRRLHALRNDPPPLRRSN